MYNRLFCSFREDCQLIQCPLQYLLSPRGLTTSPSSKAWTRYNNGMKLYIYSLQRKQYTGIYDVGSLGHLGNLVDLSNPDYCHLLIHVFFYHNIKFFRLYNANFPIHKTSTCTWIVWKCFWVNSNGIQHFVIIFHPLKSKSLPVESLMVAGIIDGSQIFPDSFWIILINI